DRFLAAILDSPITINPPNTIIDLYTRTQRQCTHRSLRLVISYHLAQIQICKDIAVVHDERTVNMGRSLPQRGRCSHSRRDVVADIHAKLGTIIKMISENLRVSIRQEHNDVLDTVLGKIAHHVVDEWLSSDRYHPLRDIAC